MFCRAQIGAPGGISFSDSYGGQWRLNRKSKSTKIMTDMGNCGIRRAKKCLPKKTLFERHAQPRQ